MNSAQKLQKEVLAQQDIASAALMSPINVFKKSVPDGDIGWGPDSASSSEDEEARWPPNDASFATFKAQVIRRVPAPTLIRSLALPTSFEDDIEEDGPKAEHIPDTVARCLDILLNGRLDGFKMEEWPYEKSVMEALKDAKKAFRKAARGTGHRITVMKAINDIKYRRIRCGDHVRWYPDEIKEQLEGELKGQIHDMRSDMGVSDFERMTSQLSHEWGKMSGRKETKAIEKAEALVQAYEITVLILDKYMKGNGNLDGEEEQAEDNKSAKVAMGEGKDTQERADIQVRIDVVSAALARGQLSSLDVISRLKVMDIQTFRQPRHFLLLTSAYISRIPWPYDNEIAKGMEDLWSQYKRLAQRAKKAGQNDIAQAFHDSAHLVLQFRIGGMVSGHESSDEDEEGGVSLEAVVQSIEESEAVDASDDPEERRAREIISLLISNIRSDHSVSKLIRDLRGNFDLYLKENPSRIRWVPHLVQACFRHILSGRTTGYPKETFPYGRDIVGAMKHLSRYFEKSPDMMKRYGEEKDDCKDAEATIKLIKKWMDGRGQAEEDKAKKARKKAAKDEGERPQTIVSNFYTALESYSIPQHELVRDLADLTTKKVCGARNLPDVLDACLHSLQEPFEKDVLRAMRKLLAIYQTRARHARRMLLDMTELRRAIRAGECDRDDEYDVDAAEEVMHYFGGRSERCEDKDEADMLWDLTIELCMKWDDLCEAERDRAMQEEKEKVQAYERCVEVVQGYVDGNGHAGDDESERSNESEEEEDGDDSEVDLPGRRAGAERVEEDGDSEPLLPSRKRQRRS